ncbi:MAG: glycosyltransferase [Nanoarchaeota archaeon]|nr:glycosyltransferase [Nanoarchaeota archaeon]MBU4086035.1 glycosyltransferase [Nanoarchaeota archaeon]
MKFSIIIPAHNEEKRMGKMKTLEEYGKFFERLKKSREIDDFEILVVLNDCKDKTIDVVKQAEKKFADIRHMEFELGGKGFAIIKGFKNALKRDFDAIGFVDADMATPPAAFYELIKQIEKCDAAIANRWDKKSSVRRSFGKWVRSRGFNILIRALFLFPYRDTQCGAKVFRRKVIEEVLPLLDVTKWAFDVCLLYWARKKKFYIQEVPTIWEDREGSNIGLNFRKSLKTSIQMATAAVRLRIINSPFKKMVKLYDLLPERVKMHH